MIININTFKLAQYICYAALFVFIYLTLDNNPLNNIFFYLMILCMIGIDYASYYNGVITGSNKAIEQFTKQINIREDILNELEANKGEINNNKINNN